MRRGEERKGGKGRKGKERGGKECKRYWRYTSTVQKKMRFLVAQNLPAFYAQPPLTSILVPRLCRAGVR